MTIINRLIQNYYLSIIFHFIYFCYYVNLNNDLVQYCLLNFLHAKLGQYGISIFSYPLLN